MSLIMINNVICLGFTNSWPRILLLLCGVTASSALRVVTELGISTQDGQYKNYYGAEETAYKGTRIKIKVDCGSTNDRKMIGIQWMARYSKCADEFKEIYHFPKLVQHYFLNPLYMPIPRDYNHVIYYYSNKTECSCEGGHCILEQSSVQYEVCAFTLSLNETDSPECLRFRSMWNDYKANTEVNVQSTASHRTTSREHKRSERLVRRDVSSEAPTMAPKKRNPDGFVGRVWQDGPYLFVVEVTDREQNTNTTVNISLVTDSGAYLPAINWPLLPFYGAMCILYLVYAAVWLVLSAMQWKDLLRVQFWIGGVIVLGMLEKAVFYAYYQHFNSTGESNQGTLLFAELVSCLKRMLARMLVIIVSLGFGIVKPRLGPVLHKVVGVGIVYFVLALVESCLRTLSHIAERSKKEKLASIPVAVIDAAIFYWIFVSLAQTMRTLRLRRNIIKLSLYRHFTNTLIFAALASVCFMIWVIKVQRYDDCMENWKEVWLVDAFWHILFVIILLVIMALWRPTANNQRYAYSMAMDTGDDDEEQEPMMTDAYDEAGVVFDGMKMRTKSVNGSPSTGRHRNEDGLGDAEDTLKWVEENIPNTMADSTLPAFMDSDEEIMTTRMEVSKME